MTVTIGRRELLAALGGAAVVWPLAARAQQSGEPVIGFLNSGTATAYAPFAAAFRQGLSEAGYFEGRNVAIEYRWAEGHYQRLAALADDLIGRQVTVIAATSTPAALAAKAATTTIPIVFTAGVDPIAAGLIGSLNRPSGNLTGVNVYLSALWGKRLGLLRELVPNAGVIGMLVNPNFPDAESQTKDVKEAGRIIGQQVHIVNASSESDIDSAFAALVRLRVGALLIASDAFFVSHRDRIVAPAARHVLPTIYPVREFIFAGGTSRSMLLKTRRLELATKREVPTQQTF
jgi:putative tryptophan/tyrosine transport system substrate-binding protein